MSDSDWKELNRITSKITSPAKQTHLNKVCFSIYNNLGPKEKAVEYYKKILLQGTYYDRELREKYKEYIDYDSLFAIKGANMDTTVLNFFHDWRKEILFYDTNGILIEKKEDRVFFDKLDSLIKHHKKWPGFDVRGIVDIYKEKPFRISLFTSLMDETKIHSYYKLIGEECKKGNESWRLMTSLSFGMIRASQYSNRFYKIRNLKMDGSQFDFDDDYTQLSITSLGQFLRWKTNKGQTINIYPTELWGGSDYIPFLNQIIDDLVERGFSYESINIKEEVIEMDENEKIANDYFFVFEIVEKKLDKTP